MTAEELRQLPKIELHCHLDGSLSKEFIESRLGRSVEDSEISAGMDCGSLEQYLEKFGPAVACLQDEEGLCGAGYDVLRSMGREQVCYAEIRFAPLLSATEAMDVKAVIEALLRGLERGHREFGVEYNVIVCAMRHHSMEENGKMLRDSSHFLGKGVCAADLAGAEASYPMAEFVELFQTAASFGMPCTIHAGECGCVQNIVEAVGAGAARIGHGIAMQGHPKVQEILRERRVGVELCPTSNLQTKAVMSETEYPIREFLDAGLLVSVNTDNRTVSRTSLTRELEWLQRQCGISDGEVLLLTRNAVETAFADEAVKARLRKCLTMAENIS